MEPNLQDFDRYLHNEICLKCAQILVTDNRFMIFDIEGHSIPYEMYWMVENRIQHQTILQMRNEVWI